MFLTGIDNFNAVRRVFLDIEYHVIRVLIKFVDSTVDKRVFTERIRFLPRTSQIIDAINCINYNLNCSYHV